MADSDAPSPTRNETLLDTLPKLVLQPALSKDPLDPPHLLETSSKESLVEEEEEDVTRKRPKRVHPVQTSLSHPSAVPTLLTSVDFAVMFPSRLPSPSISPQSSPHIKPLSFSPIQPTTTTSPSMLEPRLNTTTSVQTNDVKPRVSETTSDKKSSKEVDHSPAGFWDYFKSELLTVDYDDSHDIKNERVHNFLHVPVQLEKESHAPRFNNSFLFVFTFLQIRLFMAFYGLLRSILSRGSRRLKTAEKVDLMKGCLFYMACYMMNSLDASMIYHSVRGQAVIKLYVIFNVLEVCDRLCSAFGHDILDSLFSKTATNEFSSPSLRRLGQFTHFLVALVYVYLHAVILFYQVMTLNVAVNSFSNSLLTLMMSNQFVEIKGSVFKKFEKENVFQLSCSDIVERFQLIVFMTLITVRNYLELTGGGGLNEMYMSLHGSIADLFLNNAFSLQWIQDLGLSLTHIFTQSLSFLSNVFSSPLNAPDFLQHIPLLVSQTLSSNTFDFLVTLLTPFVVVIGTEIIVDGLKHAFITKFNHIRPEAYHHYMGTLCRDLAGVRKKTRIASSSSSSSSHVPFSDRSYTVARRVGFLSLPIACLVLRNLIQTMEIMDISFFPWTLLYENANSVSLWNWLIQGHSLQHVHASLSFNLFYSDSSVWMLHVEKGWLEMQRVWADVVFQSRFMKFMGLGLVSLSIWTLIFTSLIFIKMKIGLYLHQQAHVYLEQTAHPSETQRRTSVYVPSDTERRAIIPAELDDKRLDQIDRYTFIKRIV